jgi:hypothetical protein
MNNILCEREDQTAAAVRNATVDRETALHAQRCPACSDILLVGEFLFDRSTLTDRERTVLPDAARLWKQAQMRASREAVRLALRPIRFMKIIAVVALFSVSWLRSLLPATSEWMGSWMGNLNPDLISIPRVWPATAYQAEILLGFAAATALLTLGSWYMVRQE